MTEQRPPEQKTFAKEVLSGLKEEARTSLRWAIGGAIVGAVVLGGIGLIIFGLKGLLIGAGLGAVVGGVGLSLLYLNIQSPW